MIEQIGGRKYVLVLLGIILAFVLVLAGKVDTQRFLDFLLWAIGLYSGANVGKALVDNFKK
jgi:hypothetical protein